MTEASLWHSFQDGGWAMWPIFALGLVGVGAAGRFAWRGEHQLLGFVRWMLATLLVCGVFGTIIGMQRMLFFVSYGLSERSLPEGVSFPEQRFRILLEGTREASNCFSASLLFILLICLLAAVGQRRFPLLNPSAAPR
jgi:hypothetical protein